jgi:HEPN domain-containing protein
VRALADRDDVPDHVAGFLAQQAIEKSLKAVLTAHGARFERSHDIDYLCSLIEDNGPDLTADLKDAVALTPWAVEIRYADPSRPTHSIAPTRWLPWLPSDSGPSRRLARRS